MRFAILAVLFSTALAELAACGSTSEQGQPSATGGGSGGTDAGAKGGTHAGGSGGVHTGGSAGCAGHGTVDCVDYCTLNFVSPICVGGVWGCPERSYCPPDAGFDGGPCASDEVLTAHGCMSCDAVTTAYSAEIETARKSLAGCNIDADCMLAPVPTKCSAGCPVAVSKSGEGAFKSAVLSIDVAYCTNFEAACGFSTPACASATVTCDAGNCEAVTN